MTCLWSNFDNPGVELKKSLPPFFFNLESVEILAIKTQSYSLKV